MVHIVALVGSLRKASCNLGLLREVQKVLRDGATIDIIVPGDLPLFNQDIEAPDVVPESVKTFRSRVKTADVFLFAACEYNYGISGVLKNAIDWASRGPDGNLFGDRPAGVIGAAGGQGSIRSQNQLRDIAVFLNLHMLNHPTVAFNIFSNPTPFDLTTGDLTGASEKDQVARYVDALVAWARRINITRVK
ncbi:NAD(P)H-dependent oxidoreductase [archaeon]|nr:MAG: NAD(P)H-dependent oxidoreductase [archaeon]